MIATCQTVRECGSRSWRLRAPAWLPLQRNSVVVCPGPGVGWSRAAYPPFGFVAPASRGDAVDTALMRAASA